MIGCDENIAIVYCYCHTPCLAMGMIKLSKCRYHGRYNFVEYRKLEVCKVDKVRGERIPFKRQEFGFEDAHDEFGHTGTITLRAGTSSNDNYFLD
jgi:hypothetical protein